MKQEDYLETIYNIKKNKGHVRVSDIANELKLSMPSVSQMMQRLQKEGCVKYEPYSPLKLTPKGRKIGKKVAERHKVLEEFLSMLNISKRIREKDIHGIEHSLSPITLRRLKEVNKFLNEKDFKPGK